MHRSYVCRLLASANEVFLGKVKRFQCYLNIYSDYCIQVKVHGLEFYLNIQMPICRWPLLFWRVTLGDDVFILKMLLQTCWRCLGLLPIPIYGPYIRITLPVLWVLALSLDAIIQVHLLLSQACLVQNDFWLVPKGHIYSPKRKIHNHRECSDISINRSPGSKALL